MVGKHGNRHVRGLPVLSTTETLRKMMLGLSPFCTVLDLGIG